MSEDTKPKPGNPMWTKGGPSPNPGGGRISHKPIRDFLDGPEGETFVPRTRREKLFYTVYLDAIGSESDKIRTNAQNQMFAYDMGRPVTPVEHSGEIKGPVTVDLDDVPVDVVKRLREAIHAAAKAAGAEPEEPAK